MAKLVLSDLGTTLSNSAANVINANNDRIEAALENTLSRTGTSPNQMEADLDLNNYDVLNVGLLEVSTISMNGQLVVPDDLVIPGNYATAAQGALADSALQPSSGLPRYQSRSAAEAAVVAAPVMSIAVQQGSLLLFFVRDGSGTALTTGGGAKWSPLGDVYPDHFALNTTPGTTDMTSACQAAIDWAAQQSAALITDKVNIVKTSVHMQGLYKTSAAIVVKEGVRLTGSSPASTVIYPSHSGVGIEMGGTDREYANVCVENLAILGAFTGTLSYGAWTPSLTHGIRARKCLRSCRIQNVMVARCGINISVEDSYQFAIEDNYLIYAKTDNIYTNNCTASRIVGNRIDWAEQNGVHVNNDVLSSDETISLTIKDNAIQICWRNGVLLKDTQVVNVTGNFFEANYREATSDSTHDYADVNIVTGVNSRGLMFNVSENFFTAGSSPNFDSYTAVRCDRAKTLRVIGNTCRDSRYWRFVDADNANVEVYDVGHNTLTATFNNRVAYNNTTGKGRVSDSNDGVGVDRFIDLIGNRIRVATTVSASNQTTDGRRSMYHLDCSAGNRQLTLRDAECLAGTILFVKKTDGGANNLTVLVEGGSTKTIDGLSSQVKSGAYASFILTSDGTNWFLN